MNVPYFLYSPELDKGLTIKRSGNSHHIVPERIEIDLMGLKTASQPYTLLHQAAMNSYVITVSFVKKVQDPTTLRETICNHTFFLPLGDVMNDYVQKLRPYQGKEGAVNV